MGDMPELRYSKPPLARTSSPSHSAAALPETRAQDRPGETMASTISLRKYKGPPPNEIYAALFHQDVKPNEFTGELVRTLATTHTTPQDHSRTA